jgi:hypothetical protein
MSINFTVVTENSHFERAQFRERSAEEAKGTPALRVPFEPLGVQFLSFGEQYSVRYFATLCFYQPQPHPRR